MHDLCAYLYYSQVALDTWGANTQIFSPLIEVEAYFVENQDSTLPIVLIGNVFKDLTLRPSVRLFMSFSPP